MICIIRKSHCCIIWSFEDLPISRCFVVSITRTCASLIKSRFRRDFFHRDYKQDLNTIIYNRLPVTITQYTFLLFFCVYNFKNNLYILRRLLRSDICYCRRMLVIGAVPLYLLPRRQKKSKWKKKDFQNEGI